MKERVCSCVCNRKIEVWEKWRKEWGQEYVLYVVLYVIVKRSLRLNMALFGQFFSILSSYHQFINDNLTYVKLVFLTDWELFAHASSRSAAVNCEAQKTRRFTDSQHTS